MFGVLGKNIALMIRIGTMRSYTRKYKNRELISEMRKGKQKITEWLTFDALLT